MADIREFSWALIQHWFVLMSCAVFTIIGLYGAWTNKGNEWLVRAILVAAVCLAFVACFLAWKDEHATVTAQGKTIDGLQGEINSLTQSKIMPSIVFSVLGSQLGGAHAGIIVNLNNSGAPSAIVPDSWQLIAKTSDGRTFEGWPNTLKDKNLDFCFGGSKVMRFVKADALYLKAADRPIDRNGYVQGFLWFGFPKLNRELLLSPDTTLRLTAKSVSGQGVQTEISIATLQKMSIGPTKFFAGIQNPTLIEMPCKEDLPYY